MWVVLELVTRPACSSGCVDWIDLFHLRHVEFDQGDLFLDWRFDVHGEFLIRKVGTLCVSEDQGLYFA